MNIMFFTNKGGVREHNEDAMFFAGSIISCCSMAVPVVVDTESADKCFVVVDGMGGYHGGDKAANIVASFFSSDAGGWNIPIKSAQEKITRILGTASHKISEAVSINPQYNSMGAALAGIVFCFDGILAFIAVFTYRMENILRSSHMIIQLFRNYATEMKSQKRKCVHTHGKTLSPPVYHKTRTTFKYSSVLFIYHRIIGDTLYAPTEYGRLFRLKP